MTTRNATTNRDQASGDGSVLRFSYSGTNKLGNGDVGSPIKFAEWADRSVQFLGTFGAAGTIVWEGSNDGGTTWATLTDPQGNAISKTSAGITAVVEAVELARPHVTGGDGTTSLECHVIVRRQSGMRA